MEKIIEVSKLSKRQYSKYKDLMYFQIWHNKQTINSFVIEGLSNILKEHSPLYDKIILIFKHCKDNNIPCAGTMIHHSEGCFWANND